MWNFIKKAFNWLRGQDKAKKIEAEINDVIREAKDVDKAVRDALKR